MYFKQIDSAFPTSLIKTTTIMQYIGVINSFHHFILVKLKNCYISISSLLNYCKCEPSSLVGKKHGYNMYMHFY